VESGPREVAQAGVGQKGRGYGGGIISTPVSTLFRAEQRMVFDVQIPQALRTVKTLEGRSPRTTEEFMEKVIVAYDIRLPALPPGDKYVWDPETEQLMVEHPPR